MLTAAIPFQNEQRFQSWSEYLSPHQAFDLWNSICHFFSADLQNGSHSVHPFSVLFIIFLWYRHSSGEEYRFLDAWHVIVQDRLQTRTRFCIRGWHDIFFMFPVQAHTPNCEIIPVLYMSKAFHLLSLP